MDERMRFVIRLKDGESMASLCREFGISRKSGYKLFERYEDCGLEGLSDRARRQPLPRPTGPPPGRRPGSSRRRGRGHVSSQVAMDRTHPQRARIPLHGRPSASSREFFGSPSGFIETSHPVKEPSAHPGAQSRLEKLCGRSLTVNRVPGLAVSAAIYDSSIPSVGRRACRSRALRWPWPYCAQRRKAPQLRRA